MDHPRNTLSIKDHPGISSYWKMGVQSHMQATFLDFAAAFIHPDRSDVRLL
jgi:hypothetical protein